MSDEERAGRYINDQFERFILGQLGKLGTDTSTFESAQRYLSSKVSLRFESLINTRGGLGRLSQPLPTFRVRYTRCVLEATGKEILQGSQQMLGRVTVTVSFSRILFTAKQSDTRRHS